MESLSHVVQYITSILLCHVIVHASADITTDQPLTSQLNQILAKTASLEAKLNEEIAKRVALEKEVQSKNDLTEFLRQDVLTMNKTVEQEKTRWNQLETRLSGVETTVKNIQSTLEEDRGALLKVSRDIRALDSRLTNDISSLNKTIQTVLTSSDMNSAMVQNLTTLVSSSNEINSNQTIELSQLQTSSRLLNETLQQEISQISSAMSVLATNVSVHEGAIDTLMNKLKELKRDLVNQNGTLLTYQNKIENEISSLNSTSNAISTQYLAANAATKASVDSVKGQLASFQSTEGTKMNQLTQDLANMKTRLDQYISLTGDYNKTLSSLSSKLGQTAQTGSSAFFFASKPVGNLHNNQPLSFTLVRSNVGSAFDGSKSLFTCATPGIYLFTVTLQKDELDINQRAQCWLKRNGAMTITIDAHSAFVGSSPSASSTVILQLNRGDRVQLTQCTPGTQITVNGSTFSGALLHSTQ